MRSKLVSVGLAVALGAGLSLSAYSQVKPETMVKQRQAVMTLQLKYFLPLALMAQGKMPFDQKIVSRNAEYLGVLDQMAWDGFDPSTKGTDAKTRALPAIWSEPEKFKQAQENFKTAVSQLEATVKSGDEGKIKTAIGSVNKACGACHDGFRERQ